MFSSLSRQRCFLIQIRQPTKIWEFWQLLSSLLIEKETPHAGSSWKKESPTSFQVLQSSSCPCHTPMTSTLLRQDLALSQKVHIPGAFCMQEIQQQRQCKLSPQPGPEPFPWQPAAPTGVRDPPLPCRDLAALALGNSDGLFPLFSHLHQEEKRRMTLDRLTKHKRCSLVKGVLYFDLLHILTLLKLCTYTPVLHRSENLSCFFPSSHAGSQLPLFLLFYQLVQPPQVHELLHFQPQCPLSSGQWFTGHSKLCTALSKNSVKAACPHRECEV